MQKFSSSPNRIDDKFILQLNIARLISFNLSELDSEIFKYLSPWGLAENSSESLTKNGIYRILSHESNFWNFRKRFRRTEKEEVCNFTI